MKKLYSKIFGAFLAGYIGFLLSPAGKAFAVSENLNLDTDLEYTPTTMPSFLDVFLRMAVSLIIIALLAYVAAKFFRKNMKVLSKSSSIQVLDQYALSMNKGVYITRIAGKVFALGVTDNSINVITEITDKEIIEELDTLAREREMEPIIPPSILERILPGMASKGADNEPSFSSHIQDQIKKLQSVVDNRNKKARGDDAND